MKKIIVLLCLSFIGSIIGMEDKPTQALVTLQDLPSELLQEISLKLSHEDFLNFLPLIPAKMRSAMITQYLKSNPNSYIFFVAQAAENGLLQELVKANIAIDAGDRWKKTPLMLAADRDFYSPKAVQNLLDAGANPNSVDIYGNTALMEAASSYHHSNIDKMKKLLDAGAQPNKQNNIKNTALIKTKEGSLENRLASIKLLIKRGANPHLEGDRYKTLLDLYEEPSYSHDLEIINFLREQMGLPRTAGRHLRMWNPDRDGTFEYG